MNGGIEGVRVVPSTIAASGDWSDTELYLARRANLWPSTVIPTENANLVMNFNTVISDLTGINTTINAVGSAAVSSLQSQYGGASLRLPNVTIGTDYLSIPSFAGTFAGDFTIEFWFYPTEVATSGLNRTIMDLDTAAGSGTTAWWTIYQNTTSLFMDSNNGSWTISANCIPTANQWYHVAFCRSGSTMRMFVNGAQVATSSLPGSIGSTRTLFIGYQSSTGRANRCFLDDVRISPTLARYTGAFTPPAGF